MKQTTIYATYAMVDPRTNKIRYVSITKLGATAGLSHRISNTKAGRGNPELVKWMQNLSQQRLRPTIVVLEETTTKTAALASRGNWIEAGRKLGWELANGRSVIDPEPTVFTQLRYEPVQLRLDLARIGA